MPAPDPIITPELVETAARALAARINPGIAWDETPPNVQAKFRGDASTVLDAAAPLIDRLREGIRDAHAERDTAYAKLADHTDRQITERTENAETVRALQARLDAVRALIETHRPTHIYGGDPLYSRSAILRALDGESTKDGA